MHVPSAVVVSAASRSPLAILEYRVDVLAKKVSRAMRRIFANERALLNAAPAWTTPTFEVADYLPVPVLSVEHKIFGAGFPLHRKLLDNGSSAVVVCYGNISRTLLIDSNYWITPIEVLMGLELLWGCNTEGSCLPRVTPDRDNYCSPLVPFVAVEPRTWSEKEERARLHVKSKEPTFVPGDYVGLQALRQKRHPVKKWVSAPGRARVEPKWVAKNRALMTRHKDQQFINGVITEHELMRPIVAVLRKTRVSAGGKVTRMAAPPIKVRVVRCEHTSKVRLERLIERVAPFISDERLTELCEMPYKEVLRFVFCRVNAFRRWQSEKRMVGKLRHGCASVFPEARTLKSILDESRTFPN